MRRAWLFSALLAWTALGAQAACIVDDTGSRVCLDRPASRVVSLYGAFSETAIVLGAQATLVARTANDDAAPSSLPSVGTGLRPDVETLLALSPDLVVSRAGKSASEALAALRARGLVVAAFDPKSPDEVFSVMERLGILLGRETEAKQAVAGVRGELDRVGRVASQAGKRPRVIFEVRSEPLSVAGTESLVHHLLRVAGGENAVTAARSVFPYDLEALLAADPDVYLVQEGPMNRHPAPPAQRPNFATLRAVREGRVAVVDEELVSRPGPRIGKAAEALSRLLHPDLWRNPAPK